jgi:hypothetical protein
MLVDKLVSVVDTGCPWGLCMPEPGRNVVAPLTAVAGLLERGAPTQILKRQSDVINDIEMTSQLRLRHGF